MRSAQNKTELGFPFFGRGRLLRIAAVVLSLGTAPPIPAQVVNLSKNPADPKPGHIEGNATWYKVPAHSRTRLRAGKDELTAAHNRLAYGTRVRVTHLGNGKSVVVRITDRVISRNSVIDLSKEAATQLDMVHQGSARVRLEILPDDKLPVSKTGVSPW
jgi:rare lipoprotein A